MPSRTIRVVAAVFTRERANTSEILIFRRAGHEIGAGKWEFPGGKVEDGESDSQALHREIMEELNIPVKAGPLLGHILHPYPQITIDLYAYLVSFNPHDKITLVDHDQMIWVNQQEVSQYEIADADVPIVTEVFAFLKARLNTSQIED